MDERERQELALDIARRVRLLCVQEAPQRLLDALPNGSRARHVLYGTGPSIAFVDYEVSANALHIIISVNFDIVARVRLDAPSAALAELQRST